MILYRSGIFFEPIFVIPFIVFAKSMYSYIREKPYNSRMKKIINLIWLILTGAFSIFCLFVSIIYSVVPIYAYYTNNYATVEGKVENFVAMPAGGHAEESFSIKGVKFSYCDYSIAMGYRKTQYYGGVIRGNGQNLKIFYLPSTQDDYEHNTIIYIEEY